MNRQTKKIPAARVYTFAAECKRLTKLRGKEKMRYIASKKLITYYDGRKVSFLSAESNSYYNLVLEHLRKERDNFLGVTEAAQKGDIAVLVNSLAEEDFQFKEGKYFLAGKEIPEEIAKKVLELKGKELPYQPLLNFWQKAKEGGLVSQLNPQQITSLVGTRDIPLTWDGNLIMYMRSSWVRQEQTTKWANYLPEERVRAEAICGGFNWVSSSCPDAGLMFEVQVNPVHILNVSQNTFTVKELTFIGEVKGKVSNSSLYFLETKTNTLGEKMVVRAPYSPESLRAYLTTLVPGYNKLAEQEVVSVRLTGC